MIIGKCGMILVECYRRSTLMLPGEGEELRRNWGGIGVDVAGGGFTTGFPLLLRLLGLQQPATFLFLFLSLLLLPLYLHLRLHSIPIPFRWGNFDWNFDCESISIGWRRLLIHWVVNQLINYSSLSLSLSLSLYVMLRNRSILSALPEMLQMWRDGFRSHLHIRLHPRTHGGLLFTAFLGP